MEKYILPAVATALIAGTAFAKTLDADSVQGLVEAIALCADCDYGTGDVVNLAEGVYDVADLVEVNKKAIRIVGAGKGRTILDGGYPADPGRTNGIFNVTKEGVVISGITFRNASRGAKDGGAISVNSNNHRFEVVDCSFSNCHARAGGGIAGNRFYSEHHAQDEGYFPPRGDMGVISGCDFVGCMAHDEDGGSGGGAVQGGFWIEDSTFDSCAAYGFAPVVFTEQHMMVTNCVFSNCPNATKNARGGIWQNQGKCELRILDCTFSGMTCNPLLGRASSGAFIDRCVFTNCAGEASNSDSGIIQLCSKGRFRNCLVTGNQNPFSLSSECFENCTIAGNVGGFCIKYKDGGGVVSGSFTNCVIAANTPWGNPDYSKGGTGLCWHGADSNAGIYSGLKVANCAFEGVSRLGDVIALDASGATDRISREIDAKGPKFRDAAGGNYVPRRSSALVEAGVKSGWMDSACDLAGNKRCLKRGQQSAGAMPDIGCYEFFSRDGFKLCLR